MLDAKLGGVVREGGGGRFWLGLFFFVLFAITPAFIPLVVLLPIPDGAKAALSASMVLGIPEVFAIISAWLLGRETYDALMRRKREGHDAPDGPERRTRLRALMTNRRKAIWRAAQHTGWHQLHRRARYRSLLARTHNA